MICNGHDNLVYPQYKLDYAALNIFLCIFRWSLIPLLQEPNVYDIVQFLSKYISKNSQIPKMPYFNGGFYKRTS